MSGDSDHLGDAMHDFHSRDVEDDFDADRRWNAEMQRRALQQDRIALAKLRYYGANATAGAEL